MPARAFHGEIRVASRIVDFLSSGLYSNPAACLKELVNNSYDADAREVNIFVKPDADRIIVEDDGVGMTREEFIRHFSRISESHKREGSDTTPSGRPKIGKIGIGVIAANELCDVMELTSTTQGSSDLLRVEIDFKKLRLSTEERRRTHDDFAKGDYRGRIEEIDKKSHFTRVFLKSVRGEAREVLAGASRAAVPGEAPSLYGLSPRSVVKKLATIRSWTDLDLYSQTMLGVALNVPVMYPPDWAPPRVMKELADVEDELRRLDFHVWYDGAELRKPVVLAQAEGAYVLRRIKFDGLNVRARGYFFAQHGTLRPQELQGILIRIRHAAVGEYDRTLLGFPSSLGPLFQRWMSAEILADDRLEDALNIDRRTLRTTAPEYVELQAFLHEQLQNFLSEIRDVIYARGRSKREERRIEDESDRINEILENRALALPPSARNQMRETLVGAVKSEDGGRLVRRKYSPSDLLELTLSVAHETLDARAYRKFAVALAERLTE